MAPIWLLMSLYKCFLQNKMKIFFKNLLFRTKKKVKGKPLNFCLIFFFISFCQYLHTHRRKKIIYTKHKCYNWLQSSLSIFFFSICFYLFFCHYNGKKEELKNLNFNQWKLGINKEKKNSCQMMLKCFCIFYLTKQMV